MNDSNNIKRLNKDVLQMIMSWISWTNDLENLNEPNIKSIGDLNNGSFFLKVIQLVSRHLNEPQYSKDNLNDIKQVYKIIKHFIEEKHGIEQDMINYGAASNKDQYQLTMICFVLLNIAFAKECPSIQLATEKFDDACYHTFSLFLNMLENYKIKNPPIKKKIYEEFLCMSKSDRKSIPKHNRLNASPARSLAASTLNANYLSSPLNRFSLCSPLRQNEKLSSHRLKLSEDDFQKMMEERKRLESLVTEYTNSIHDLNEEVADKEKENSQLVLQIDELKRKIVDLNTYKQKAYECDSANEKSEKLEQENTKLHDKCKTYAAEVQELQVLRKIKDVQDSEIAHLKSDQAKMEKNLQLSKTELNRLKNIEMQLKLANEKCTEKENTILGLVQTNGELKTQIIELTQRQKSLTQINKERIENLEDENASAKNQLSILEAKLANSYKEFNESKEELQCTIDQGKKEYEELSNKFYYLESEHRKNSTQLRDLLLNKDIAKQEKDALSAQLDTAHAQIERLDTEITEYKTKLRQTEQKCQEYQEAYNSEFKSTEQQKQSINKMKEEQKRDKAQSDDKIAKLIESINEKDTELFKNQNESQQMIESFGSKIKELEKNLNKRDQQIDSLSKQVEQLNSMNESQKKESASVIHDLNNQLDLAREKMDEKDQQINSIQTELKNEKNYRENDLQDFQMTFNSLNLEHETNIDELNSKLNKIQSDKELIELEIKEKRDCIDSMTETINQLNSNVQNEQISKHDLNKDWQVKLEKMVEQFKNEKNQKELEFQNTCQSFDQQIESLNKENTSKQAEIAEHLKQIELIKQQLNESNEQLLNEKSSHKIYCDELGLKMNQTKQESEDKLKELNLIHQNEKDSLIENFNEEKRLLKVDCDKFKSQIENLTKQHELITNELSSKHKSDKDTLTQEINQLKKSFEIEREQLNSQIYQINQKSQIQLSELELKSQEKEKMHNQQLDKKTRSHELKCNELQSNMDQLKQECQNKINELAKEYKENMERSQLNHDNSIKELNERESNHLKEISTLSQNYSKIEAEFKQMQFQFDMNQKEKQFLECKLSEIDNEKERYKMEIQNIQKNQLNKENEVNVRFMEYERILEGKNRDLNTLNQELCSMQRQKNEFEANLSQLVLDKNLLAKNLDQKNDELICLAAQVKNQSETTHLEWQKISKDYLLQKDQNEKLQKRLRDELTQKQSELDQLKLSLRGLEDKEKHQSNILSELNKQIDSLQLDLNKEKDLNLKLNLEFNKKTQLCQDLYNQVQSLKEFNIKYEEHYKAKKKVFEDTDKQNGELQIKLNELQSKCVQDETRIRTLVEENNCSKEKLKTISFEIHQLRQQKEDLIKKLNEASSHAQSAEFNLTSTVRQNNHPTGLMTPKPIRKAFDDTCMTYTSPNLRTQSEFLTHDLNPGHFNFQDDITRRFSIDSISRGSSNATNGLSSSGISSFNRFNAISENEFEEPTINHKFLIDNSNVQMHRLSTLQTRNQQLKPHLKSSYALETMLPPVSENQIRGNKENKDEKTSITSSSTAAIPRTSDINSKTFKRRNEDSTDAKTPKKSHITASATISNRK